ncbi:MAG TPA: VCBS repeat-containing protein [Candidatus Limnocylindria bacterium]|nr:VCBS repeat-containing protein [Candidatus Limnocylindria bacterium]
MTKNSLALAGALSVSLSAFAADYTVHTWKKIQLSDQFWSEGANIGDFNHDSKMDVVSGPYWWAGPDFHVRHEYYPATKNFSLGKVSNIQVPGFEGALGHNNTYSDNFFAFTADFNKDGWDDILVYGFPGKDASWYENPKGGKNAGGSEHWTRHKVLDVVDNESPTWGDITGDGKPEIICSSKGFYGYASPDWNDATKPWVWHSISPNNKYHMFTHGLGYGDVDGDGKADLLEKSGWWEQPASLEGDPQWKYHAFPFAPTEGSSQMYAYDVNGDGLPDVVTALAAHNYGLAWYEQLEKKNDKGEPTWKQHLIMGKTPKENKYGLVFSQLHAVDLVDMDGDGLKDIVTGKRFWAHGAHGDADPAGAAVAYWFKLVRSADRSVDWVPYLIDNDSGIGTQVVAADVNGDKLPDVIVGNKKGTFVNIHGVKTVTEAEWQKAQPKPLMQQQAAK